MTVFEEYRGFIVQGEHTSTQIDEKDVFVYSEFLKEKIGYTDTALPSGMAGHRIKVEEMWREDAMWRPAQVSSQSSVPNRSINNNKCKDSHWDDYLQVIVQRAAWVADRVPNTRESSLGVAYLRYPGTPNEINCVDINKSLMINLDSDIVRKKRNRPTLNFPLNTPTIVSERISEAIKRVITHEVGHCIGLAHPFDHIELFRPYSRIRYHDRAFYNRDPSMCWEEGNSKLMTRGVHDPLKCGSTAILHKFWVSGTTVMDYGSEGIYERYRNTHLLDFDEADYITIFSNVLTYTIPHHNREFMFVLPGHIELHEAGVRGRFEGTNPTPSRKTKPQWSPSTDATNRDNDDTSDRDNDDTSDRDNDDTSDRDNDDTSDRDNDDDEDTGNPGDTTNTPPAGSPGAPRQLSGEARVGSVYLTWLAPVDSGTTAINGYEYHKRMSSE